MIHNTHNTILQVARFGIVGGAVTLFAYMVFLAGIAAGLHYLVASIGAWMASVVVGFFGHRRVTFGGHGARGRPMARYAGVCILQFLLGTATLAAMVDLIGLAPWIAYPANVALTAGVSYVLMSRAVFQARQLPST